MPRKCSEMLAKATRNTLNRVTDSLSIDVSFSRVSVELISRQNSSLIVSFISREKMSQRQKKSNKPFKVQVLDLNDFVS